MTFARFSHRFLLVASSCLFGVFCLLPSVFQRVDHEYPFQGVEMLGADAEVHYAARVREVADGFPGLGNTFYSAPKDQLFLQPPLPEIAIAWGSQAFGLDPYRGIVLSRFVFGALCFAAFAAFLSLLVDSPAIGLLSTIAVFFGGPLLSAPWDLPHFLHPSGFSFEFLRFSRTVNPQWSDLFFFLSLFFVLRWLRGRGRRELVFAGFTTGVLVYSYVYAWSLLCAALGLLTLFFTVRRDVPKLKDLGIFWFTAALFLIPYAVHLHELSLHPWFEESSMRLGLHHSRMPVYGVWLGVLVLLSLTMRRLWPRAWPLLPCLGLGAAVAINQHVVTGTFIVPHHYHWYFIQPLSSGLAVAALLTLLPKVLPRGAFRALAAIGVTLSLCTGFINQRGAYEVQRDPWGCTQELAPVFTFVSERFHHPDVLYSQGRMILNMIPVTSSADVYTSDNANNYLVSVERARDTYFFELWLTGLSADDAAVAFAGPKRAELGSRLYAIYFREAAGGYDNVPDAIVEDAIHAYRKYLAIPLSEKLTRYPLTAVVTTPDDPTSSAWSALLACATHDFQSGDYGVWTLIPAGERGSCLRPSAAAAPA